MADRIRDHDWSVTALGPLSTWSADLRYAVRQMLDSAFPAALAWGAELTTLHNDGLIAFLGDKPDALGRSLAGVWAEAWQTIGPAVDAAMSGRATVVAQCPLVVRCCGVVDEARSTIACSPVRDADGTVRGVIVAMTRGTDGAGDSEERFRTFVTASADAVYRMSADWSEMCHLEGRDFLSDTHEPDSGWLERYIHPDDRVMVHAAVAEAIRAGSIFALIHRVIRRDGSLGWTSSRAVPVRDGDGQVIEWLGTASDVTDRILGEQAVDERRERYRIDLEREVRERTAELETSRDLLRGTVDASTDMIQVFEAIRDERGAIVDFRWLLNNLISQDRYGTVNGQTLLERNPGVVPEGIFDTFRHVTETGEPQQDERHYVHEQFDGWFLQTVVKLNDGVATTTKDISAWKAAQGELLRLRDEAAKAELHASEARLAAIFQEASVGLSEIDADGRFVRVNDELCRLLGRSRAALMLLDVRAVTHPGDVAASEAALAHAAATGAAGSLDKRYMRGDGSIVWANSRVSLLRHPETRAHSFLVVTADLTARYETEAALRHSEELFRQFGAASSDALWIRDAQTLRFEYLSPAFAQITGRPNDETVGTRGLRSWLGLVVASDRRTALDGVRRVRRGERAVSDFRIRRADGHVRWVRDTSFPLLGEDGRVDRIGGIQEDVTEAKQTSERLQMLVGELQHRTRNLIAVVRSVAERTMIGATTLPEFRDNFRDRLDALSRVQALLSRLEEHDRVYFDELIRTELTALGAPGGSANRVTLHGPVGVPLRSSTVQIVAMALHELGTNALKYGALQQAGGRLTVSWRLDPHGEGDQPWLHIDWRETGVVMPVPGATPQGTGQGRELIERALPYQLKARTGFALLPDGVHCTIAIPVSAATAG